MSSVASKSVITTLLQKSVVPACVAALSAAFKTTSERLQSASQVRYLLASFRAAS